MENFNLKNNANLTIQSNKEKDLAQRAYQKVTFPVNTSITETIMSPRNFERNFNINDDDNKKENKINFSKIANHVNY